MFKVLLVAESPVVRGGLRFFLAGTGFDVVAEVATEKELRDGVQRFGPTMIVVESDSPLLTVAETMAERAKIVPFDVRWTKNEFLRTLGHQGISGNEVRSRSLTPRETETLRCITEGLSNKEIARKLGISVETVKEHVHNLLRKAGLADRTQAAIWAVRNEIVPRHPRAGGGDGTPSQPPGSSDVNRST